ncbi:NAD(P)/FAD-dependent oxidoreductase [Phaeobacter gallaeciensis]|uniref:NAD(P)/FAD-dependent oxidoreductase n=1 Tax=Phaeobacter gallaeciensis TaxID=60890 RepID=UPI00237FC59C|nr:FAD-dependent oxidoreductase [Phaeobacter gallaeciensis]MDE4099749.1 FAD-dependent oxidoreductase [Phaeobacter gallaeciensis]MDE4108516.1 FAD-dependent oxidoreductase [Phaeobacter gallaeciensis]MDE4110468.1 FAD-dependent oxidoreductase [Phaeobacter gallaeciensis]MDE4117390.1 FAD-dependent oxidoreductase [Phaeobacter gallaeciensis]MDE4121864.1 FAD-dependent oxidoreductase [Phaeobacter gallaeciensis]
MSDFIVIGGGIAGISAAARLSELGSVTVLEAEEALGYHASGRSAAMFEESYGNPAVVALNKASADYHYNANGGYLTPRGFMLVAGPGEEGGFAADVAELDLHKIHIDDAYARVPILNPASVTMAALHEDAQDLDTDRMIQDFARVVRGAGGQVITRAEVTAIQHSGSGWQVTAGGRAYEGKQLINAAGAWVDRIATLAGVAPIGITPKRRSMARLPAPGGHDVTKWPMMMGVGECWYAKPDAGKLLVSPADADPVEPHDAFAVDMVLAEGLARYEEKVTEPVTRVESNWAGLRSFVSDGALVLGADPDRPDFIWCAAQGGYGFQTAPAASRLLRDLIGGKTPELDRYIITSLSPERLR